MGRSFSSAKVGPCSFLRVFVKLGMAKSCDFSGLLSFSGFLSSFLGGLATGFFIVAASSMVGNSLGLALE